jgi:hypothetical protein
MSGCPRRFLPKFELEICKESSESSWLPERFVAAGVGEEGLPKVFLAAGRGSGEVEEWCWVESELGGIYL